MTTTPPSQVPSEPTPAEQARGALRFVLLQARNEGDPVRGEERVAFATRLRVAPAQIQTVDVLSQPLDDRWFDGIDAVLVGGSGEYSVLDDVAPIRRFIDFLGEVADAGVPTFASCFGFQALVVALGGEVIHDEPRAEVGTFQISLTDAGARDPLFGGLPSQFLAQQGHKDRASRMPESAVNLARTERAPFQALRLPGKPVYATQFHPELDRADQRLRYERYLDHYSVVFGESEAMRILDSFQRTPDSCRLLGRFVDRVLLGEGAGA